MVVDFYWAKQRKEAVNKAHRELSSLGSDISFGEQVFTSLYKATFRYQLGCVFPGLIPTSEGGRDLFRIKSTANITNGMEPSREDLSGEVKSCGPFSLENAEQE